MSHQTFNTKWANAIQDLTTQLQLEYLPVEGEELPLDGSKPPPPKPIELTFDNQAVVYVKYLQIYNSLEAAYDQLVHPQKRESVFKVLESTLVRLIEMKHQLLSPPFNPRPTSRYLALDEVVTDLKLPSGALVPRVPRYFVDHPSVADLLEIKIGRLEHWLRTFKNTVVEDDLLDPRDPFQETMSVEDAIRLIQKNERGRSGIVKAKMVAEWRKDALKKEARQKQSQEKSETEDLLELQMHGVTLISAHWKGLVARRRIAEKRRQELQFLGMTAPPRPPVDYPSLAEQNRQKRKKQQEEALREFEKALETSTADIREKEAVDIMADLKDERRKWYLEYRRQAGTFPKEYELFYTKDEPPPVEEEEDPKKKKDEKKKEPKKDNKKKKKGEEDIEPVEQQVGPSGAVIKIKESIDEYMSTWKGRDESRNFDQRHDPALTRATVRPTVEEEIRQQVDALIKEELENLINMYEKAKDKKKKGGKKKGKKGGKKKGGKGKKEKKWCIAQGLIGNKEDLFPDLVKDGILKKIKPVHLSQFYGEFAFLGASQRYCPPTAPPPPPPDPSQPSKDIYEYVVPPSAGMVKQLLVENVILPLGSDYIRQRAPFACRSLLLYGSKNTGKSFLARAIATEVGALFFDLSPQVIEGLYTQPKTGAALLVHKTFLVAQECAPAVIYMDQVDQIFAASKKKKKGEEGGDNAPNRIKKELVNHLKQIKKAGPDNTSQDRILFIGCTTQPYADHVDTKELLSFFEEKVWLTFPDYPSRVFLWKQFMKDRGVSIEPLNFPLSNLAHVSEGYPAGSIKQAVDHVLTDRRIQSITRRPLELSEFVGPLSRTSYCWPEEWKQLRDFDHSATGEKDVQDKKRAGDAGGDDKGKKDDKKKKKK
ncbi:unnamed protein product [Vitrella brassicaformis CCMP3155]|uniref:ATPase AAA-type core domain-containing protein n=1 Tax=Vitrella brassicaformis (strain CCMP3155) TaxID=1169540 RepID=A0A0G4FWQ9_VITBC|nr:unnamed protein product [Vitrella brassicaformis CCMP3155]|eukprot:CEM19665.1 unnamed protein product [Vitrella brassicaformis CCMP3155]